MPITISAEHREVLLPLLEDLRYLSQDVQTAEYNDDQVTGDRLRNQYVLGMRFLAELQSAPAEDGGYVISMDLAELDDVLRQLQESAVGYLCDVLLGVLTPDVCSVVDGMRSCKYLLYEVRRELRVEA